MAFQLPAEQFIVKKLQENFPDIDVRGGTAFRDMLITPLSLILQPYRDQVNILKRNQSLSNYSMMLDDEMDMLIANIFMTRRSGSNSTGTIRLYFDEPQDVQVTTDIIFSTREGLAFNPAQDYFITAEEIDLNTDGILYYYDIQIVAEKGGTAYNVNANTIIYAANLSDSVLKVDNLSATSEGVDEDTNEELYYRSKFSVSVRDLVSKNSIISTLLENLNSIVEVFVIGFGDEEMLRDIGEFTIATSDVVTERSSGETDFTDIPGIFTDSSISFIDNNVSPGHSLIIMDGLDVGQYPIAEVAVNSLTIDGTFSETRTGVKYRVGGIAERDLIHMGGKVDIYLNTPAYAELTQVTINSPQYIRVNTTYRTGELRPGESRIYDLKDSFLNRGITTNDKIVIVNGVKQGVYKIDSLQRDWIDILTEDDDPVSVTKRENGVWYYILREYYENETTWSLPMISFSSVNAIDPITREILATLEEGVDYEVLVQEPNTRYSVDDDIIIKLIQENPIDPDYYVGSTLEFNYFHDSVVSDAQQYVDNDLNRVLTASLLVRSAIPSFVDIELTYKGDVNEVDLESALTFLIQNMRFDDTLKASEIIQYLQFFNVTYVQDSDLSVKLNVDTEQIDGTTLNQQSTDYIKVPRTSKFVARDFTIIKTTDQFEVIDE